MQANKEIILSAGSIGTPQILQLSGIGDPADLTPLKIPVLVNSPMVGKNMMDHPLLPNIWNVNGNDSFDHILRNANLLQASISQWATNKTGFIANNVINNFGFARLNSTLLGGLTDPSSGSDSPHYEMIFAVCYHFSASFSPRNLRRIRYLGLKIEFLAKSERAYTVNRKLSHYIDSVAHPNISLVDHYSIALRCPNNLL